MDHLREPQEEQFKEIDLLNFVSLVRKRKKLIFSFFLLGLISGIFWYFLAPSSYQGTIILKVGGFDRIVEATGKREIDYFENIDEIVERLKKGAYNDYPKLEVVNPRTTALVEISLKTESYDESEKFLEKIATDILSAHNQKVENKKEAIDQEISFLKGKIEDLKKDIFYFMARGEQVALLNLEIYNMEKLINELEGQKADILTSQTIKGPEIKEKRPGYLAVLSASMLGLFVGLIFAFFADWLKKNREKI